MRLAALLATTAAALAAASTALAGGTASPKLTAVRSEFPERSYVLTLPRGLAVGSRSVVVSENGAPVAGVSVAPTTGDAGSRFGTVLLIDTSNSMAGGPLRDAYAAARAFAARRSPTQRLAVVTFDARVAVRLPLTSDGREIAAALERPPATVEGTHLYDALAQGVAMLDRAGVAAGSLVVLSDGADVGSRSSAADALAQARRLHMRVFAVGLASPQFTPSVLRDFATATGAAYSQATRPRELTQIYDALGYRLANEYLLQYRSFAGPDVPVAVRVTVAGIPGAATASYRSPPLAAVPVPPLHRSLVDAILQSWYAMLVVAALIATLVGLAAAAALRPRQSMLRQRLGAFVSVSEPRDESRGNAEPAADGAVRPSLRERFERDIEIGEIPLSAGRVVAITAVATVVAVWLLAVTLGPVFAVFGLGTPFVARWLVGSRADRQRRLFGEQLPDNLQVLSSALRSGHSLVGALAAVVEDAPEPSRREFRRVVADERAGIPLDLAVREIAGRMDNRDLAQVALVAALQRETGGNSADVLDRVAETVRERAALRRLVRTLTAQGRMARWIVSALPVALFLLISLINGEYMKPMLERTLGQVMVAFAAAMVIAGSLVIRKIVDIKL